MAGKKRTRTGEVKPSKATQSPIEAPVTEPTPQCAQPQLPSSKASQSHIAAHHETNSKKESKGTAEASNPPKPAHQAPPKPTSHTPKHDKKRQKLAKLPPNTTITKRPLLHPSIPSPFSSSQSPKILYITSSTPFIPALKRIRTLLSEIQKRAKQSQKTKRPGRLTSGDVEREIVADMNEGKGEGEKVYIKATGRAIPRALGLGVEMQGEEGYVVRVEMGSVRAVDDIQVSSKQEGDDDAAAAATEREDVDIPETRIRTVSSVTVSVGLK